MHVLTLDLNRSRPSEADESADGPRIARQDAQVARPDDRANGSESKILQELWPPVAIARRMEARERELQRMLDDMRASIDLLRRDREALIGQLRDLGQPTDCPVELTEAGPHSAQATGAGGHEDRALRLAIRQRRRERCRNQGQQRPSAAPVPPPLSSAGTLPADALLAPASATVASSDAVTGPSEDVRGVPDAAPGEPLETASQALASVLQPRTPEEEFDALVQRLRAPAATTDAAVPQAAPRVVRSGPSIGRARLAAVAATAALIVLGTPTVGQVQDEAGPTSLPSRARFLDVITAPDLRVWPEVSTPSAATAPALRLELTTVRPAWIHAVIDDGWKIEQVVAGGVTIPVDGQAAISLILSDGGAVRLRVNGEDQGPAGDDGQAIARQFESSTVVTTTPSSPGNTPE